MLAGVIPWYTFSSLKTGLRFAHTTFVDLLVCYKREFDKFCLDVLLYSMYTSGQCKTEYLGCTSVQHVLCVWYVRRVRILCMTLRTCIIHHELNWGY